MTSVRTRVFGRKALLGASLALVCGGAVAQPQAPSFTPGPGQVFTAPTGYIPSSGYVPTSQSSQLRDALAAAKRGDTDRAQSLQATLSDPIARKIVTWAMVDSAGAHLDYFTLAAAQRDIAGWPRSLRLRMALERSLDGASLAPQKIVEALQGREPATPEGAMALAGAYQQLGRSGDAQALIRRVWRETAFEAEPQSRLLTRFGAYLSPEDHAARLDTLLLLGQGPAMRAMMGLVSYDRRQIAEARLALRGDRSDANALVNQLPTSAQADPGLALDRARYYRKHNLDSLAVGLVRNFPTAIPDEGDVAKEVWTERRLIMNDALRNGDYRGAYAAASNSGLPPGTEYADAEFFAGWIALTKLKDPARADGHFAHLQTRSTPITLSRAFYWRGRTAEASGDPIGARSFWSEGGRYPTTFYGQLSASKAGQTTLVIGRDPVATASDRARFESRELVRAARILADAGDRELLRSFVLTADDQIDTAAELSLLVDMARNYGEQDLSMRVVRAGAMRNILLPERGYPVLPTPVGYSFAEPAFALAISRQESNFDPHARSKFAVGVMQLRPGTAADVARKIGVGFSASQLEVAEYNIKLGSSYLASLVGDFGGSFVMTAAGYNAGPGRPRQWVSYCGDPRGGAGEPVDFVECIPFSETRNYVQRVIENMEVYRARLNGGSAPLTIEADLKRGGWTPPSPQTQIANQPLPSDPDGLQNGVSR